MMPSRAKGRLPLMPHNHLAKPIKFLWHELQPIKTATISGNVW
jgi:hypothetical protein